ncbi:hypothetical protein AcV7_001116 [Taiwanofungus camphoratus]|nr:hypothetical protein AcV7_001116 [Antrodia cinnamomea]
MPQCPFCPRELTCIPAMFDGSGWRDPQGNLQRFRRRFMSISSSYSWPRNAHWKAAGTVQTQVGIQNTAFAGELLILNAAQNPGKVLKKSNISCSLQHLAEPSTSSYVWLQRSRRTASVLGNGACVDMAVTDLGGTAMTEILQRQCYRVGLQPQFGLS